jgi:hypothetical protein
VSLTEFNGLPAHILIVHFVIALVPLTALLLLLSVFWPQARHRIGVALPVVAFVTLASVPLAQHAGGWLQSRVPSTALVRRHTQMGGTLLPWAGLMFLLAVAVWVLHRRSLGEPAQGLLAWGRAPVAIGLAVVSLVLAAGSLVTLYRIGDSGAKAAWEGRFSSAPRY